MIAWAVAFIATCGSLYFSEIRHFPPCVLCWYQRIAVYASMIILLVGVLRKDKNVPYYVLPLTTIGTLISIFHNLLYYKLLPESAAPCQAGISCTTQFVEYFGFVTIPLMSLAALLTITISMYLYLRYTRSHD